MPRIVFPDSGRFEKNLRVPGTLFAFYLIINGVERFFIEKIRVNSRYSIFGFHPTQAEIISTLLMIGGGLLYYFLKKKTGLVSKLCTQSRLSHRYYPYQC